jgi:hypothetical protein
MSGSSRIRNRESRTWLGMAVFILCLLVCHATAFAQADPLAAASSTPRYPGSFIATASMSVARACHTATTLSDGTVLIVGGYGNNLVTQATAELYDPLTGSFSPAGSMRVSRQCHTATLLNDGTVLITGGGIAAYNSVYSSAELYDPATQSFASTVTPMHTARAYHTATLLADGTVLIAGGLDSSGHSLAQAELYDPATRTFTLLSQMRTGHAYHTATLLDDGRVLIAGWTRKAELYDPATQSFGKKLIKLRPLRSQATATLLDNGEVLIAGGVNTAAILSSYGNSEVAESLSRTDFYDGTSGTFAKGPHLITSRYGATATLLLSGDVLIIGGIHTSPRSSPNLVIASLFGAEGYSAADGTFSKGPSMAVARDCHTASLLDNGDVLVVGGETTNRGSQVAQRSAELFVP